MKKKTEVPICLSAYMQIGGFYLLQFIRDHKNDVHIQYKNNDNSIQKGVKNECQNLLSTSYLLFLGFYLEIAYKCFCLLNNAFYITELCSFGSNN